MKIMHLMLSSFYIDNYSYQENMLPKYHKKLGHEVEIVASLFTFDENGKGKWLSEPQKYNNEYEIPVTRLAFNKKAYAKKLRLYDGLMDELIRFNPEVIFIHNIQFCDIKTVKKYLEQHTNVVVYADNHADFMNSASNWLSKNILHGIIWKYCAKQIEPYVKRFYGVLPARVDFLSDVYSLPKEKITLLEMGADDEKIENAYLDNKREEIRRRYCISEDSFLIVTGGKIDRNKPETLDLMRAVNKCKDTNVHLMVFGSVVPELKEEFESLIESKNITYVGWVNSVDIYDYFLASDLAFFPGKHSVLWEQAVGCGLPCVFRKMEGFTHIDVGGNCLLLDELTEESYVKTIKDITTDQKFYLRMKSASQEKGIKAFSYTEIAKRSLS